MINQVYRDEEACLDVLNEKIIAVLGYGIQGRPQAQCLRDSGIKVIVGAGDRTRFRGWDQAERDGFEVFSFDEATRRADIVLMLVADPAQPEVYWKYVHGALKPGSTLCFCHGFNLLYGAIRPAENVNVVLYVPNAPGHLVREKYLQGSGIYGAIAVEQDATGNAKEVVLAIAKGVGSTRVGVVEVNFQFETEGDNFEEQCLYGGAIYLMKTVYATMIENGYPPLFAYSKCVRSLQSVMNVMDQIGIEAYISTRSSRTCEFAVRTSGPRVVNTAEIKKIFEETATGNFAARWMQEWALGMPHLHRMRRTEGESNMEQTGKEWRRLFNPENE